jgi:hypothetical protein
MSVPLTAAHVTASQTSTSGSAGLAGGFLPVAARQVVLTPYFATAAAPSAAAREKTDQTLLLLLLLLDAIPAPYPADRVPMSAAANRSGRRVLTSQYGAGSAGSVISTRTPRLR